MSHLRYHIRPQDHLSTLHQAKESFSLFSLSAYPLGVASKVPLTYHKNLIEEVFLQWLSFWKILISLQRSPDAVTTAVFCHLADNHPFIPFTEFGLAASARNSPRASKQEPTVLLRIFKAIKMVSYPGPDLCLS